MPVVARDGVTWCWLAQHLADQGPAALRRDDFDQHPLFPLLILGTQSVLRGVGASDSPVTWQRAGQTASLLAGIAVVWLTAVLARELARRYLVQPAARSFDVDAAGLWAAALAAILPFYVQLSVDVMSESTYLVFYLAGALALLRLPTIGAGAAVGLLAGLAFLVRPEGVALALAGGLACCAAAVFTRGQVGRGLAAAALLAIAFAALAAPYWLILGGFSAKQDKELTEQFAHALPASPLQPGAAFGRLVRQDHDGFTAGGQVVWQTLRAGRFVVPLLALPGIWMLRRLWLRPPWLAVALACAGHAALLWLLLMRHGYLDPRHTLTLIAWCLPFAGLTLAGAAGWPRVISRWSGVAAAGVLLVYALRVPNGADAHQRVAADWLRQQELPSGAILLGGASEKRMAFYAGIRHQSWNENIQEAGARLEQLRNQLLNWDLDVFAIEIAPGVDHAGYQDLVGELEGDAEFASRWRFAFKAPRARGGELRVFLRRDR